MSIEPDVTRAVRSWLADGADRLPDRVLDAVLEAVPATPQRRPLWPPRRLSTLMTPIRVAAAVAAIALLSIAGLRLLPATGGVGGPAATPTPTPTPTATPVPTPTPATLLPSDLESPLAAASYRVGAPFGLPFTIDLPAGWTMGTYAEGEATFRGDAWFGVFRPTAVFPDPCRPDLASPAPAATAAELLREFRAMKDFSTGLPVERPVGGTMATRLVLVNTIDTRAAGCQRDPMLPLFAYPGSDQGAQTNGGTTVAVYLLDTAGGPVLIAVDSYTSDADLAAVEEILGTIRFE